MMDNINHTQQTEIEEIKKRSIADNSFMKAPNGEDTKLTEKQWLQVRTKAFKEWFGDWELALKGANNSDNKGYNPLDVSKVIDENGEPMVVYHGSPNAEINVFNRSQSTRKSSGLKEFGHYFTTNKKVADIYKEQGNTIEYEKGINNDILRLEKALELVRNNKDYLDIIEEIEKLKKLKDGKIYPVFLNLRNVYENDGAKLDSYSAKMNIRVPISYKTAIGWDAIEALAGKNRMAQIDPVNGIIIRNVTELDAGTDNKNYLDKMFKEYGGDSFLVFDDNPNLIKSAIDNNGAFSFDNDDIRFRFIGEKGATNLDKAEEATHRLDNLNIARDMEQANKDEKSIKMATGWERGADSKWRYEVPDNLLDMKRVQSATEKDHKQKHAEFEKKREEYLAAKANNVSNNIISDLDNECLKIVNERESCFSDHQIQRFLNGELEEINSHIMYMFPNSDLLKAYPKLLAISVNLHKTEGKNVSGHYSHYHKEIILNVRDLNQLNNGLIHEIQHAIQYIEGFAKGSNPNSFVGIYKNKGLIKALEYVRNVSESNNVAPIDAYEYIKNDSQIQELSKGHQSFVRYLSKQNELKSEIGKQKRDKITPYEQYLRTAGEVESRNVEFRLGMTDQERRESLARDTEDVALKDQIILENDLGLNMSCNREKQTNSLHNIEQAIDDISKVLGVVIEKVESREHLPSHLQKNMNDKGRYPGMYDQKTDKVYVILNEILNEADAKATVLHEALGHKGLRALKGKGFEKFLNDVCESMPSNKREEYLKRFDNNKLLATEEYLAEFAEGYKNPNAWKKVKAIFNNFLRKIGINIKMSDGDLMYTFKRAQNKLTPSYLKENTAKAVTITPTKTTTGKNIFFAKFGVTFNPKTYTKMVEPLVKANSGTWDKKYKAVLFSKLTNAVAFKNSLSEKIHNKDIPALFWKKEKGSHSPSRKKSHKR